jgi:16S rRNA (uracil1498-N3)-methyltransferase
VVDGSDRAVVATFYAPGPWPDRVALNEGASHHASVKRLAIGDSVRLTSGDGRRAHGVIAVLARQRLEVECDQASLETVPALPRVALWAPVGDRERMLLLAEKAVELGASSWRSIVYRRSRSVAPRGEGPAFLEKLRARMIAALEQSGSAWLPTIEPESSSLEAIGSGIHGHAILLDTFGAPIVDVLAEAHAPVAIACGPEGGVEPAERDAFTDAGWRAASLGPNVLRFETAGIAGLTLARALLRST